MGSFSEQSRVACMVPDATLLSIKLCPQIHRIYGQHDISQKCVVCEEYAPMMFVTFPSSGARLHSLWTLTSARANEAAPPLVSGPATSLVHTFYLQSTYIHSHQPNARLLLITVVTPCIIKTRLVPTPSQCRATRSLSPLSAATSSASLIFLQVCAVCVAPRKDGADK
jgi:hypothetical protein